MAPIFEPMTGRYVRLEIEGIPHCIYFEEAGQGIPLVCLHAAGADSRQFRHLLCDDVISSKFRVVAFDYPWHGKSFPPVGYQHGRYELTMELYIAMIRDFCGALGLERPVVMGCSIGG